MKSILPSLTLIFLLLTSGCAQFNPGWYNRPHPGRYPDAYARADLDELLGFGADMANKTGPARAHECRALRNRQKEAPSIGIQLHLMTGRLLSDACGDISRILDGVESISPRKLPDERVRQLVSVQTEALKRLSYASRRVVTVERKQKAAQGQAAPESKTDETQLLREKLEAIRSIEKKLDESGEGN